MLRAPALPWQRPHAWRWGPETLPGDACLWGGGGAGTTSSGLMLGKVLLHTLSPAAFISALEGRQSGSSAPVLQIRK